MSQENIMRREESEDATDATATESKLMRGRDTATASRLRPVDFMVL